LWGGEAAQSYRWPGKDIEFVTGLFGQKLPRAETAHECFAAQLRAGKPTHGRRAKSKGVEKFGFRHLDFGFQFATVKSSPMPSATPMAA